MHFNRELFPFKSGKKIPFDAKLNENISFPITVFTLTHLPVARDKWKLWKNLFEQIEKFSKFGFRASRWKKIKAKTAIIYKILMLLQLVNFLFAIKLSSDFYQGSNIYISVAVARTDTREITPAVKTYNFRIQSGL